MFDQVGNFFCKTLFCFSEREPDDWEDDPSLYPTHTTMFMEKSKQAIINGMSRKKSQMHLAGSQSIGDFTTLKKASSCSTIYIDDSTVSQPNLKNTIKCVSLAIYYHIKNRHSDTILDIFDEKKQPLTVSKYKRELITTTLYATQNSVWHSFMSAIYS